MLIKMENRNNLPALGLDLGGTKIAAAIVTAEGQLASRQQRMAMAYEGPRAVIARITSTINDVLEQAGLSASRIHSIGVAAAGFINQEKGIITASPNLPGWENIPLREMVQQKYGIPVVLLNDAKSAAVGEHEFGAGRGIRNMVFITVSTGIGSGIIINNELYFGHDGVAGEIGHMTIDIDGPKCACGNIGCLEVLASGSAMVREIKRRLQAGEYSILLQAVGGNLESINGEKIEATARQGDKLAQDVINKAATYLGVGLVNVVNIFNPEMIVIGGGISNMGNLVFVPALKVMNERAIPISARSVRVVPAQLGADAGIIGVTAFARRQNLF